MTALKSLTFTTLPKPSANPTLDRRTKIIARLEEQKTIACRSDLHAHRAFVGKKRDRRKVRCREEAARFAMVDADAERFICVLRSGGLEANRVRKRQSRNRGAVDRQAAVGDRHADCGDP